MKIAISAISPRLDPEVDPHFGRCHYFVIADPQTMQFEAFFKAFSKHPADNLSQVVR